MQLLKARQVVHLSAGIEQGRRVGLIRLNKMLLGIGDLDDVIFEAVFDILEQFELFARVVVVDWRFQPTRTASRTTLR